MNLDGLKIVAFDLETIWDMDKIACEERFFSMSAWPGRTMKADINSIITFGYKVLGEEANTVSVWDFEDFELRNINDDFQLCAFAYELLHDAHYIITHNGKGFDFKFLQTRLKEHGLPSLPSHLQSKCHGDTRLLAKQNFSLYSNSLKDVANFLQVAPKISTSGKKLWNRVYQGDREAMREMAEYCKQDVDTTVEVFMEMLPFVKNLPNQNAMRDTLHNCPNCGSSKLQKKGPLPTKTAIRQRWLCMECGTSSSTTADNKPLRSL